MTNFVQSMDQKVTKNLKKRYRRILISKILQHSESEDKDLLEIDKKIPLRTESTVLDVLVMRKWRASTFKNSIKVNKQKEITKFFKR